MYKVTLKLPRLKQSILLLFTVFLSFALKSEGGQSKKVDNLYKSLNKSESPGMAILVVKNGKILHMKGYGMANLEYQIPITQKSIFDVASLSKQFTAMAISMLVENGKIAMQDDIRKYIPEMPDFGTVLTIDHLIHHTSGLRDWTSTLPLAGWPYGDAISFNQILYMTYHQKELNFKPGSEYLYSNTGYNVLAEVVQRVSGLSFSEWMKQNLFDPLGMKNTFFQDDYSTVTKNRASSYYNENNIFFATINNATAIGSSSLQTNLEDFSKWVINLDHPLVGGHAVVNRMFQKGKFNNDSVNAYAWGLKIGSYQGIQEINHSGSWAAYASFLSYYPDQHLSVVVLQNSPLDAYKVAHDVADLYLTGLPEIKTTKSASKQIPEFVDLPAHILEKYTGTFQLGHAWYSTIFLKENKLMIRSTGETEVPFQACSDSTFWAYNTLINFYTNDSSKIEGLYFRGMTCPKVKLPTNPLSEYVGEFYSEELETSYVLSIQNNQLIAKHPKNGNITLSLTWTDGFEGSAWFMGIVEFYRDKNGQIQGFLVSTGRSRRQRFEKRG